MHDIEVRPRPYAAFALLALQGLVAAGASLSVWLDRLSFASCGGRACDFDLMLSAGNFFFVSAPVLLAISVVGVGAIIVANRTRPRNHKIWLNWVPVAGIVLTLLLWGVSWSIFQTGLHPSR